MAGYAFPRDLLGGIQERWNAVPARQGFELPEEPILLELLETCYHASSEPMSGDRFIAQWRMRRRPGTRWNPAAFRALLLVMTDDQLVRLAPVADIRRTLIGCDQRDGSLHIWGLFEHGHAWVQYSAGDPPMPRSEWWICRPTA